VTPTRPLTSRRVTSPYNYPFSDNVPTLVADLAGRMVSGYFLLRPEIIASASPISTIMHPKMVRSRMAFAASYLYE